MDVGLGPGHIVSDGSQLPLPQRGTVPQFSAHVCCGQTAVWIKMPLGREVGLGPGDIVLDGDPAPLPQKEAQPPPLFGPGLLWPNGWMDQDATWYGCRPRSRRHCIRWGTQLPHKKGTVPHFLAHVYCGRTAGWIKMPLGTAVGLGPSNIVRWGPSSFPPPKGGGAQPKFSALVSCGQTVAHLGYC